MGVRDELYISLHLGILLSEVPVVYRKRVSSTFSHIFTHFYTFFHIFPSPSLHFPNSCHKLNYSKEKLGNPQDTFDGFFNFEPETICFRKFEKR